MAIRNSEIAERLKGIRLLSDVSVAEMARELHMTEEEYMSIEKGDIQITVSNLLDACEYLNISMTELLTGEPAKLHTYSFVKKGRALAVERNAGYKYENLAYAFADRRVEPLLVLVEPHDDNDFHLNSHDGQEFHYCLEGRFSLKIGDYVLTVEPGDSVYFNSTCPHGMVALDNSPAKILVVTIK